MTISISLLGDDYSIIASDTRAVNEIPVNGSIYEDNCEKIFLTDFGWLACMGSIYVKLLLERYMSLYEVKTRSDIYKLYEKAMVEAAKKIGGKRVRASSCRYSINYFKDGVLHMEVETADILYKRRKLKEKNILIVRPPKETKRIKRAIEKYAEAVKTSANMHESIYHIASIVHEISKLTKLINDIVTVGISYKVSEDLLVYLKITGKAKDIIKLYRKAGDLSAIMLVVKSIETPKGNIS